MIQDRFEEMWEIQRAQQEALNLDPRSMTPLDKLRVAKDYALGLQEEVSELARDATHYKAHVLKIPKAERGNIADEAADVFKYLVSICQLHGVRSDDLFDAFKRKTDVVADRARGYKLELERNTKLVITDLDGCVADLSGWQRQLDTAGGNGPMSDGKLRLLESLKEDFYRGGGFRDLPPIPGARETLRKMRAAGYSVAVITARPYWQYKRLYSDTIEWLKRHDIEYDLILFNKDKAEAIYEHIHPAQPLFFIEDRAKHCLELANIGVKVLHLSGGKAGGIEPHPLIHPVKDWAEIERRFAEAV